MNVKRVLTASFLIPSVIFLVLYSNEYIALCITYTLTIFSLREYFELMKKVGILCFEKWIIFCTLLLNLNYYQKFSFFEEIIFIFIAGCLFLTGLQGVDGSLGLAYSLIAFFMISYLLVFLIILHSYDTKILLFALSVT
jgi:CDP-diglyceride synthetase